MKPNTSVNFSHRHKIWSATGAIIAFFCFCSKAYAASTSSEILSLPTPGALNVETCQKPIWPQESLNSKKSGTVTMTLLISADGDVKQSKIIKSSGHVELDDAAHVGISKCKFTPGVVDGKPVEAWLQFQYRWVPE